MTKQYFFAILTVLLCSAFTGCGPAEDAPKFVALKTNAAKGDPTLNANSFTVTPRNTPPKIGEAFFRFYIGEGVDRKKAFQDFTPPNDNNELFNDLGPNWHLEYMSKPLYVSQTLKCHKWNRQSSNHR